MKQLLLIWTGIANGTSMITRRSIQRSLAALFVATIFSTTPLFAEQGDDSPVGVAGIFTAITTASLYDPNVGNMQRQIDDIVVPGSVGAYPLKWTRYWNSHTSFHDGDGVGASWRFSYLGYSHTTGWGPSFPDGRKIKAGAYGVEEGAGAIPTDQLSSYGITYPGHVGEIIYLNDGGRVILEGVPGGGFFSYHPIQIKDPYGQTTTLSSNGTLARITEPGGRYLQLTSDSAHIIKVEAYDGVSSQPTQWVTYHWIPGIASGEVPPVDVIDVVTYSDGTVANYTYADGKYIGPCAKSPPREHWHAPQLASADDPRYPGPMRQIAYTYNTDPTNQTRIVSENHAISSGGKLIAGEPVSTIAGVSTGVNGIGTTTATETRGDGATRTLHYHSVSYCPDCPPPAPEPPDCIPPAPLDGKLLDFTDFLGHTTTLTYESDETKPSAGFITAVADPNGHTTQYTRSSASWGILKVTHPDGSSVEQTFTDEAHPYYLSSRTLQHGPNDPVQTIVYTRADSANPNAITRKDYPHDSDEPPSYETFAYNSLGEVTSHRLASGGTESFQYDGRGLKTSYTDALGSGPGDPNHTTTYMYYTTGPWTDRLQTVTHPANASVLHATETYEYDRDGSGNPIAGRGLVTKVTYADGSRVTKTYNKYGDVLTSTDELGHTATFTYDDYGRLLTTTDPLNNVTTNSYFPTNQSSSYVTTSKLPFSTTLPSGKRTTLEYDANWRKTFIHVAPGTPDAATSQNVYDEGAGNVGHLTSTIDPRNNKTTYAYDVRDRQISTTDPLNHTTSWTFDSHGNKLTETHANGELITFDQYDAMNRLRQQTVHRDASTMDVTHSTYDAAGNLDTHTDENGNVYDYDYDAMNRPTQVTYPNAKTEIHSYDAAGNIQTYTNRAGATQAFGYDNRNRQTNFTWTDGTSHQSTTYDAASRKTEIDNDDATIGFTYDNDNRLLTQVEKAITTGVGDNVARAVTYTYDADGNRKAIQYPSGTAFNYTYTNRNQVASINPGLSGGTPIVSYQFDASGNITNRTLDNGTATAYTVDAANRDTSMVHNLASGSRRFDYAYNSVNDITAVQRDGANGDGYSYDLTQQITGFAQNGTVNLNSGTVTNPQTNTNLTFDGCGNKTTQNGVAFAPPNNMNQPTDPGISYDNNGNLKTWNGWTYSYDAQNRMRSATSVSSAVNFYYDGLNRQVARVTSSGGGPTPTPTPTATPSPTPTPTPTSTPTPTATPTPTPGPQCSPVTINDSNNSSRQITMSTTTSGATIFYTTDGTNPTHNAGTATGSTLIYTGAITAPNCQNTVYTALAYKSGFLDSNTTNHTAKYGNGFGCGGGMMMMSLSQSSTTIFSVWDGDWAILEEYTTGNALVEKYLHGYHGLVKTFQSVAYYCQDELGSTSHIANASGALLEYYKYDLYGKPTYWSSTSQQLTASAYGVKDLGNGGSRWMPELGLYDDRNRFMSPDLGRFLQPDPVGFKGDSSNLYRYCGNDWANRTDPMGLEGNPPPEGPNLIGFERKEAEDWARGAMMWDFEKRADTSGGNGSRDGRAKPDAFSAEVPKAIAEGQKFAQNGPGQAQLSAGVEYVGKRIERWNPEDIPKSKDPGVGPSTKSYTLMEVGKTQTTVDERTGGVKVMIPVTAKTVLPNNTTIYDQKEANQRIRIISAVTEANRQVKQLSSQRFDNASGFQHAVEAKAHHVLWIENRRNIGETDMTPW